MIDKPIERDDPFWKYPLDAILYTYAIIYFSNRRWLGAILLVATMWSPLGGLIGLCGLLISFAVAHFLGFDRESIRGGSYLFNSLLTSLALGQLYLAAPFSVVGLFVLLAVCGVLTMFITVGLASQMHRHWGLPSMSLPFVLAHILVFFLLTSMQTPPVEESTPLTLTQAPGYLHVACFFESFAKILFVPHVTIGVIVLVAMLIYSRLMVVYAALGYAVGMLTLAVLPFSYSYEAATHLAFNFMFCGIALGGIFFVPSRGSLVLVAVGSAFCAAVAVAVTNIFEPLDFLPIALPFNVVVLLVLYVMKLRTAPMHIHVTPFAPLSPEENFRKFRTDVARFPEYGFPTMLCPFAGQRVVTQGVDGEMTHRGDWRFALDFEVLDEPGRKYEGSPKQLDNFYTFNTPVLSPGRGTVAKTIDHVDDRPINSNNFGNNWGNLVIIQLDEGTFVKLCHLKKGSVRVKEGQRVKPGEIIGYCGNSGRSPVPHLHVQIQTTAQVGATTIPFRLRHYVEENGKGSVYYTAGIPDEDARIHGVTFDSHISECFDNIARREYAYRAVQNGEPVKESIRCRVNDVGNYVFESPFGATLTANVVDHAFYALDYQGTRNSVLYWLWLGLSRVPFIEDRRVKWHDAIDVRPMLRPWVGLVLDLTGPFFRYPAIEMTGLLDSPGRENNDFDADACVVSTFACPPSVGFVEDSVPRRIRTYVSESDWVVGLVVETDAGEILFEQVGE